MTAKCSDALLQRNSVQISTTTFKCSGAELTIALSGFKNSLAIRQLSNSLIMLSISPQNNYRNKQFANNNAVQNTKSSE